MKKQLFSLILFFFLVVPSLYAQLKEGKITYQIKFKGTELSDEEKAMLPTECVLYIRNGKSRMEMNMGMGFNTVTISEPSKEGSKITILMDMMGKKVAMQKDNLNTTSDSDEKGVEVQKTSESKKIAGYVCQKVVVKSADGSEGEVWTSDEIYSNNDWSDQLKGIKGFPLEFSLRDKEMSLLMVASAVEPQKVNEDMFLIPEGYEMMDAAKMDGMFGGE